MKAYGEQLRLLTLRLLVLLFLYQMCRFAFLLANYPYFEEAAAGSILGAFFFGIRFDLSAIAFTNALLILIHLIPFKLFFKNITQRLITVFFYLFNIPAILLNCVDLEYFKYQGKRTTSDLFDLFTMGEDMKNTLPAMARDFWYVLVVFAGLIALMVWMHRKICVRDRAVYRYGVKPVLLGLVLSGLTVVAARGGVQYKPLGILSAAQHVPQRLVPLALNTGFTVIRTLGKSRLEEKHYFDESTVQLHFSKTHQYADTTGFVPMNVVLIIMESFSSEYVGFLNNGIGYTPVLDSIMSQSLVFTNGFANAKKSIDGIPAVVAALPTLMPFSYITSTYNGNHLESLGGLLRHKGYTSGFYHGGNNGTMGFDNFVRMTGFEKYYGRNEYPGDGYDGHWGVFDEPYFRYFADACGKSKAPFVNVLFSLSSHHPYSIPPAYRNRFPKGKLPIHESIGYADRALGAFFEAARQTSWYEQTLFVITADHTGPNHEPRYNSTSGMFRVPVVYFCPALNLKGINNRVTQQCDIVPSILDLLHYDITFSAFGNSVFEAREPRMAVNFTGNMYQAFNDSLMIQYDGEMITGVFQYLTDPVLEKDLTGKYPDAEKQLLNFTQSYIQQFNRSLIRNEMTAIPAK